MSYPMCRDLQQQTQLFEGVLCRAEIDVNLSAGGDPKPVAAEIVSGSYFPVLGIGPALSSQTKQFSRRTGIPVTLSLEGDVDSIPEQYRTCLYRIVQEALTNCARHAEASQVNVTLRADERGVWAGIEDDGKGFDPRSSGARGLGLIGMQERARELNGALQIHSMPGRGTAIRVDLPLMMEATVGQGSRSAG